MNVERITVKYNGEYHELAAGQLDLNPVNPTDQQVMDAVRASLNIPNLNGFVVDPPQAERDQGIHDDKTVLNIRPTATYGRSLFSGS